MTLFGTQGKINSEKQATVTKSSLSYYMYCANRSRRKKKVLSLGFFFQPATYLQMLHNCSTLSGTSAFFLRETISVHSTIFCCYLFEVAFAFGTPKVPYTQHHNPLLIINRSSILTVYKARILQKKASLKTIFDFQTVGLKYTNRLIIMARVR